MATVKLIAGSLYGLTWQSVGFGSEVNSLASTNGVIAATQQDNGPNLDLYMDLSISLGSVTSGAGAPTIGFYMYPLNQDGTSYGDGAFGTSAAGPPPGAYLVGNIPVIPSVTGVITGMLRRIELPPGKFKLVIQNNAGVALASSANTIQGRSYNLSVV
jgi:hypothetical protein